jgi:hypothetical protein
VLGDGTEGTGTDDGQLGCPYGVASVPAHPDRALKCGFGAPHKPKQMDFFVDFLQEQGRRKFSFCCSMPKSPSCPRGGVGSVCVWVGGGGGGEQVGGGGGEQVVLTE